MTYRYGLLAASRAAGAEASNELWLGPDTLGIEVTEPELAARCGLGNIDPQHLGGDRSKAAIDVAVTWPVPPAGARLVTVRPDADAYGAMAVLALRAEGRLLADEVLARVALVSRADRFDSGPWPGSRPLPNEVRDIDEIGLGPQRLGAVHAGLALAATRIEDGVAAVRNWLVNAECPAAWGERAQRAAAELFLALDRGDVVVREILSERIALVKGFVPGALKLAYRLAPIVIGERQCRSVDAKNSQRRLTIAQYDGRIDLKRVARGLSRQEPGWGGSVTIIGSPQGTSTCISVETCIEHLLAAGA
jgi:hypothetical protein